MTVAWADRFRELLADIVGRSAPSHGYPSRLIENTESRTGTSLPGPLRDYYLSVGRHKINQAHNRLLPPEELVLSDRKLVFMEENQAVVYWGVSSRTTSADPVVYQTTELEDGEWVAEAACSKFLSTMLCWQAIGGGLPYIGYSESIDASAARRLVRGWPLVGRIHGLSAFVQRGRILCVEQGASAVVHVGARSRRDFRALVSELGVRVHDA
jgi:hypothetical protein